MRIVELTEAPLRQASTYSGWTALQRHSIVYLHNVVKKVFLIYLILYSFNIDFIRTYYTSDTKLGNGTVSENHHSDPQRASNPVCQENRLETDQLRNHGVRCSSAGHAVEALRCLRIPEKDSWGVMYKGNLDDNKELCKQQDGLKKHATSKQN